MSQSKKDKKAIIRSTFAAYGGRPPMGQKFGRNGRTYVSTPSGLKREKPAN